MVGKFDMEFDVVVAGGASAGCVLATRLTENPAITLCLIEAGGRDPNPSIRIPLGFGKLVPNPNVNWGYETEPEPHLDGRRLSWLMRCAAPLRMRSIERPSKKTHVPSPHARARAEVSTVMVGARGRCLTHLAAP